MKLVESDIISVVFKDGSKGYYPQIRLNKDSRMYLRLCKTTKEASAEIEIFERKRRILLKQIEDTLNKKQNNIQQ